MEVVKILKLPITTVMGIKLEGFSHSWYCPNFKERGEQKNLVQQDWGLVQPPQHPHTHGRFSSDTAVEGKICQGVDLLDGEGIYITQDAVADFTYAADEFATGVCDNFCADVEKTGKDWF
jgi:hypothetical protein